MACPWFLPQRPLPAAATAGPSARAPLGELWSGLCCASETPIDAAHGACNSGYARSRCPRFPADSPDDAIRFHVANEDGDLIRLKYIYERRCWPAEHGTLEYSCARKVVISAMGSDLLRRQAAAFASSWVRKTQER